MAARLLGIGRLLVSEYWLYFGGLKKVVYILGPTAISIIHTRHMYTGLDLSPLRLHPCRLCKCSISLGTQSERQSVHVGDAS